MEGVGTQGATKLANSALNKFKNHPLLKTLKAVGLDRLGKSEEAFQVKLIALLVKELLESVACVMNND